MEKPGRVALSGTIIIPRKRQDDLLPLLEEHTRMTRAESGCIAFDITPDAANVEIFHITELFESEEAFNFHQKRGRTSDWGWASIGLPRNFTKTIL